MEKNELYTVCIESISSDGNGVARADGGQVLFVPHTAVGDVLQARVVKVLRHCAYGIVHQLVSPSPDRVCNDCASWPRCGGCDFRHLSYPAELRAKAGFVQSALRQIGGFPITLSVPLHAAETTRYRNKVQYPVIRDGDSLRVGFYAERSHRVVPCEDCLLQPSAFGRIAASCCRLLEAQGVRAYEESSGDGLLRHLFLRRSEQTGHILLCLVQTAGCLPDEASFVAEMTARHPEISGIVINIHPHRTNVILGSRYRKLFGSGTLSDRLCGVPVRLSPASFLQINFAAAELLYREISRLAAVSPRDTLLDLYCGVGTIGLSMASQCKRLIGIERVEQAVKDARFNAKSMGVKHAEFFAADAARLRAAHIETPVDVAVTDPPRKGCDAQMLSALIQMNPRRIVMVSCNPATLARDLRILADARYTLETVTAVDMFPRTKHVEAVALMSKL